ncbi:MAG: aminotransferase class III-fold pyridoxal phosphate-dependent enzyme, partial [Anaerolineales bacterium]
AAIDAMIEVDLPARAAEMGDYLLSRLREIQSPLIREVRGVGLMIGIETKRKVAPYLRALTGRGVLALSAGMTVIRLLPPLVITREQIDRVVEAIADVLSA